MNALDVAFAFGRVDVDQFLEEIDADQFAEWSAFFAMRPQGWSAINQQTAHITYAIAQAKSAKKLRFADFLIRPCANIVDPIVQAAIGKAAALKLKVAQTIRSRRRGKKNQ